MIPCKALNHWNNRVGELGVRRHTWGGGGLGQLEYKKTFLSHVLTELGSMDLLNMTNRAQIHEFYKKVK